MEQVESNIVQENAQDQTVESSDIQTDIFEQVFNPKGQDPFAVEASSEEVIQEEAAFVESEPVSTPDTIEAKEDDSQFNYWQSQADKTKAEMEALKAEMEALKSQAAQPKQEISEPKLVKPTKPVKPVDYDYSEALADPESASAKYLASKEDYLEQMSDYILKKDELREEQMTKAQQEQLARQQHQETLSELQTKFNYTPEQANDFVKTMSSPESLSLDNLVKLHQLNQGNGPQITEQVSQEAQQKQQLMNQRQEKLSIPKPIGVQQGQSVQSPSKNVEDKMMDAMLTDWNKRNIF
jgi:hypothetical protein